MLLHIFTWSTTAQKNFVQNLLILLWLIDLYNLGFHLNWIILNRKLFFTKPKILNISSEITLLKNSLEYLEVCFQYFGNMRHNTAALDAFVEIVKMDCEMPSLPETH